MKIFILGCGAYASALAIRLNEKNSVTMWCSFEEEYKTILETRESPSFKGVHIPESIKVTTSFEDISTCDLIVLAIPTKFISNVLEKAKAYIKDKPIVIASKGIRDDGLFINEIVSDFTNKISVISGPSFAIDTAFNVPIGLTVSGNINTKVVNAFDGFILEENNDIIGTEICGSIKNVFAIASGILKGMGFSESTHCTFVTRCVFEISNLIEKLGGNKNTVLSYAGIGDLMLTASSEKSRNFSFGYLIGKNSSKEEINEYIKNNTIEGLNTLKSLNVLFDKKNINMPIISLLNDIIYNNKSPKALIDYLKS